MQKKLSLFWGALIAMINWEIGALIYWLWSRGWLSYLGRLFLTLAVGWLVSWWIVNR